MQHLAEHAKRIKTGFDEEARRGPFNHSYVFLDTQLSALVELWKRTLAWHQERAPERRQAHDRYLAFQAHKKQQDQEVKEAGEKRRRRDKQRLMYERETARARLRALVNLNRDVTGSSRLSSLTSHYNLK